ncbi:MAG: HAD family phosphatase [Flavobacteriales bacterium]|nr:HAD family phosphatase [Flavobacteriales bacterium]
MDFKGIKNIIFDLGGVIINLDEKATYKAFEDLFREKYHTVLDRFAENNVLHDFEMGKLSAEQLFRFIRTIDASPSDEQITKAWNRMLLDIPAERIFLIRNLARKYRIFLLSNTNAIHLNTIDNMVQHDFGFERLSVLFEKAYYSHELELRKPNPEIFLHILHDKQLAPEQTLFIDDTEEHILAAKGLNLKTHHLQKGENIVTLFHEH